MTIAKARGRRVCSTGQGAEQGEARLRLAEPETLDFPGVTVDRIIVQQEPFGVFRVSTKEGWKMLVKKIRVCSSVGRG
jgi:hypothetical protein